MAASARACQLPELSTLEKKVTTSNNYGLSGLPFHFLDSAPAGFHSYSTRFKPGRPSLRSHDASPGKAVLGIMEPGALEACR